MSGIRMVNSIKKLSKIIGKIWESYFPYLFAILSVYIFLYFKTDIIFPIGNELYAATLTLFGILMGFLSTSKSILLSIKSPILNELNKLNKLNELFNFISDAIWACFVACILNLVAFFIDKENIYLQVFWIMGTTFAICMFLRITNLVLKILSAHYKKNKKNITSNNSTDKKCKNIPEIE